MSARKLIATVIFVGGILCPIAARAATIYDTTTLYPVAQDDRNAVEYVLAVPSAVLKAPFKILSYVAAGPVILVERQSLVPHLRRALSFADVDGIYPAFGWGARSGLTGGLGVASRNLFAPGVGLAVEGSYSLNVYRHALVRVGGERWGESHFGLMAAGGWRARTRERIFGFGPASSRTRESNYQLRGPFGSVRGFGDLGSGNRATVFVEFRRSEPRDGRRTEVPYTRDSLAALFGAGDLYGLFSTVTLYEAGGEWLIDWRDHQGSPRRGGIERLRISYVTGDGSGGDEVGFWRIRGEAAQYLNIYRGRVIGVRVLAEVTEPEDGTRIPFYELASLGGADDLRGYSSDRFFDRDLAMFSVEYRWPIWRRADAVLFTDHGRVFHNLEDDFTFSNFRSDYGGAIRIWGDKGFGEMVLARSNEGFKFRFNFGGAL